MNPTFSSPVLQERVTYTWEDLQKAAAGVFTDTLTNEKARLESLAQKFGIGGKGAFSRLKKEIRSFSSERTALANGVNGERFYLLQDESALRQHDETHLFKVGIDGGKLAGDLDEALELLSKESAKTDEHGDTYSPDCLERDSDRLGKDPFMKWAGIGFCVMMTCLGISMLVHSVFQIGFCSKWFI